LANLFQLYFFYGCFFTLKKRKCFVVQENICIFVAKKINENMNTITIRVEDRSVMSGLKKVLQSMNGVVIVPAKKKRKTGIEEAMDDIRCGRVTEYESAQDMFEKMGI